MFVTALVSDGVPDIICGAQITFKFGDHALIVENTGLLLFRTNVPNGEHKPGTTKK